MCFLAIDTVYPFNKINTNRQKKFSITKPSKQLHKLIINELNPGSNTPFKETDFVLFQQNPEALIQSVTQSVYMIFKINLMLLLCLVFQRAYPQGTQYKFSHLDITNGLSCNQINCIFKDRKGFIWIGTTSGLNRYDGYKFKIYKHDPKKPNSLGENNVMQICEGPENNLWVFTHSGISIYNTTTEQFSSNVTEQLKKYRILSNQIKQVKKDAKGNFWFLTRDKGLYCYRPKLQQTDFYSNTLTSNVALYSTNILDVAATENGFWVVYADGVMDKIDPEKNNIARHYTGIAQANNYKRKDYRILLDKNSNIWMYSYNNPDGVYAFNTLNQSLSHYKQDSPDFRLNSNLVNNVIEADDGKIWIGTDHGGINVVNLVTHQITYLVNKEDDPKSLSGNSVTLYKDNAGIIWVGTYKQGINYYHSGIMQFPLYKHFITDKNSLPAEDIDCFAEESNGNVWIGTNGGGLIYFNRKNNTYKVYKHDPADPNSLSGDIIMRVFIDNKNKVWVGTYFGGLNSFDGRKFTHYRHDDKNPNSISDDRVYSIFEDVKQNLWVGTFAGGLNIFERRTGIFRHPKYPFSSDYTSVITQDKDHNIWIGRDNGIDVINFLTNRVKHYNSDSKNTSSLIANDVNTIMPDSRGLMWIGTKDGLSILDPKTDHFYNADNGINLPANNVSSIIEDKKGAIWISTNNGLSKITPDKRSNGYQFQINNFNELDGLQGRAFNLNAAIALKTGELIFGGAHGFNLFYPDKINMLKSPKSLLFTDFQVFNKSISAGDTVNGRVILQKNISETKSVVLSHNENVFSIEFAYCDYFNPDKIKYQYMLEGFDKGWITSPHTDRKATYTNLDGGDYLFKVKAQNINNNKDEGITTLKIRILPPFWKTPLAYLIYILAASGFVFYLRYRGIIKLKKEFSIKQEKLEQERKLVKEREEAKHLHQLDLMKIKFFTNVSHEFRTPLSLILSPIEDLIKRSAENDQHLLLTIKRNGKRLLNLVNQLMDFRKMEYNELKLFSAEGDIIRFIKEVADSFTDVANQRQIKYSFKSDTDSYHTSFDHDKIERILFNLLSNAFKFTPSGGRISVDLNLLKPDNFAQQKELKLRITDSGIGIAKENQEKIFERFFQNEMPESLQNQGSGIGLSIVKEFVKMHGGSIRIESELNQGTSFIICIPVGQPVTKSITETLIKPELPLVQKNKDAGLNKKPVVLLVEDNDDLRFYLKDNLKQSFEVIEANNGKDGWQKALALHPKLIVSDVNMPKMTGFELCKKIKADKRTTQIPVILLTALSADNEQLEGLDSGANDYIVKPFNFEILLSKMQNLLQMQQTLKNTYQKQREIKANEVIIVSEDEKFLKTALDYIELNLTNSNFSVEELARYLNLSRVSLYKKLLALTGKTPVDCIRNVRLKRAVQLLEKSKLSIANIGYEVGFNNAAYFAKVFKEEFGILPSDYATKFKGKEKADEITL